MTVTVSKSPEMQSDMPSGIDPAEAPVFVAVDLQNRSEVLLKWAGEHAAALKAPLIIAHIVHEEPSSPGFYQKFGYTGSSAERMEEIAARLLSDLIEKVCTNAPDCSSLHDAKTVLVPGLPPTRIAELGKKHAARMIVMGHNRRSGLGKLLKDSVTDAVIRKTDIPILVI